MFSKSMKIAVDGNAVYHLSAVKTVDSTFALHDRQLHVQTGACCEEESFVRPTEACSAYLSLSAGASIVLRAQRRKVAATARDGSFDDHHARAVLDHDIVSRTGLEVGVHRARLVGREVGAAEHNRCSGRSGVFPDDRPGGDVGGPTVAIQRACAVRNQGQLDSAHREGVTEQTELCIHRTVVSTGCGVPGGVLAGDCHVVARDGEAVSGRRVLADYPDDLVGCAAEASPVRGFAVLENREVLGR